MKAYIIYNRSYIFWALMCARLCDKCVFLLCASHLKTSYVIENIVLHIQVFFI